jgi:predicted small metal-binding protein
MKSLSCRDAGFDCDYVIQADNYYEIFKKSEKHVFNAHGIKTVEFIPAFNEKIRALIKDNT